MSKELRFVELVKSAGHPKTVTLWAKPAQDKAFMKAVRENRVLTIFQQGYSTHKDFGQIGFHEEPLALYLVFPKPLPKKTDAHVVGLKYDLIEEPAVSNPVRTVKPPKVIQKAVDKNYEVVIKRTAVVSVTVTVTAKGKTEAKTQALASIREQAFELSKSEIQNEVLKIKEK